ncbi:hypothetical protein pneo_cds_64 [Pandoravirus neocaledonia]|uniref:Uncharacterized protein n=1 Tax=Pandoravirus neocaledonia TaxID=2107708 RepID=A0A2U7UB38_9VIRU|nr:hypothetical protein pneo_cds_64 [Pandoravirus neocaledonia]AVK75671.1 hypothetical protein pneo_cds_64 [Pandoravirus neocaledonia]
MSATGRIRPGSDKPVWWSEWCNGDGGGKRHGGIRKKKSKLREEKTDRLHERPSGRPGTHRKPRQEPSVVFVCLSWCFLWHLFPLFGVPVSAVGQGRQKPETPGKPATRDRGWHRALAQRSSPCHKERMTKE